ncbi:phosphomannomutase [Shewanella algae]|uniref:phosphomannomutase n=1 Tax=Shewanella algae TaxID=38313 RepID=UPI003AAF69BD
MTEKEVSQIIKDSGISFGTSGARGLVVDFTPEVCASFTVAFIKVMQLSSSFKRLAIAIDNRPSSPAIAAACIAAAKSVGIEADYYGVVPTPALAVKSMSDSVPAIMVTGSHIPFDRNGLKFYRPDGEITKADEVAILSINSILPVFSIVELPTASNSASEVYLERYLNLFNKDLLKGKRIGIYEHSSAGRDLYAQLFEQLGAIVIRLGRSDHFVPIDTEAVAHTDMVMAQAWQKEYQLDLLFSTDGDGDRPLMSDESGLYLRGDILCLMAAASLNIEALAVPVSCNSVIEKCDLFAKVERTKIGSPYVISAFKSLKGSFGRVAGFEANGGFLLGSDIEVNGVALKALPTRDAVLPVLAVLAMAGKDSIGKLVNRLPRIYTASDRIQEFPREKSLSLINEGLRNPKDLLISLGFAEFDVLSVDDTDGLRITIDNGEVIHIRPSGNAPELRCYAEAATPERAVSIVTQVFASIER